MSSGISKNSKSIFPSVCVCVCVCVDKTYQWRVPVLLLMHRFPTNLGLEKAVRRSAASPLSAPYITPLVITRHKRWSFWKRHYRRRPSAVVITYSNTYQVTLNTVIIMYVSINLDLVK